jgi:hypothetical protein
MALPEPPLVTVLATILGALNGGNFNRNGFKRLFSKFAGHLQQAPRYWMKHIGRFGSIAPTIKMFQNECDYHGFRNALAIWPTPRVRALCEKIPCKVDFVTWVNSILPANVDYFFANLGHSITIQRSLTNESAAAASKRKRSPDEDEAEEQPPLKSARTQEEELKVLIKATLKSERDATTLELESTKAELQASQAELLRLKTVLKSISDSI